MMLTEHQRDMIAIAYVATYPGSAQASVEEWIIRFKTIREVVNSVEQNYYAPKEEDGNNE